MDKPPGARRRLWTLGSMERSVAVRPIAPTDSLEELTDLLHAAYASLGAMGLNYTAIDQPVEVTQSRIKCGTCFVAVAEGKIVGTITVEPPHTDEDCPYVGQRHVASAQQFAVAPMHQRAGIGSRLLNHAESWAHANGYSELVVDTAEPADHLVALYHRRGYEHVGFIEREGKRYRSVLLAKRLKHAA